MSEDIDPLVLDNGTRVYIRNVPGPVNVANLVVDPENLGPPGTVYTIRAKGLDDWHFSCQSPAEVQAFMRGLSIGELWGYP